MQDETFPAEIDPWDEWLAISNQQTDSSIEPLDVTNSNHSELDCSAQCGDRPLLNKDEPVSENWTVPTAEQLNQIISILKDTDCPEASNNHPFSDAEGQEASNAVKLASYPANLELSEQLSQVAESRKKSEPKGLSVDKFENISSAIESLDSELRSAFLDDATFCMGAIEAAAMLLETDANNREAILQISRQLHTLKGASASVGLSEFADRLHSLEEVIRIDQLKGIVTPADLLLERLDWFRFQLSAFRQQKQPSTSALSLTESGEPLTSNRELFEQDNTGNSVAPVEPLIVETAEDEESVRVKTSQLNRLMDMLSELVMLRNRRQIETNELREIYHELNRSVTKLRLLGSLNAKANTDSACHRTYAGAAEDSHRLLAWADSGSLQLSEIAADVQEVAQRVRECTSPVAEGNEAVSQFIRQFRFELVELCRAPTTGLFQRLQRVVRDSAKAEGKKVRLESIGAAATVERSLQQRLYEPLLHVVRNSVCHGIETAEQRQAAGKSDTGVITLEVISAADLLVIEVRDDGGGLNYQAIRQRAVQQGLLASGQSPTEQELAQLIFHPGFSTRQSANQQAGRGVGMDVVASTLARLGGWIDVDSVAGKGATIRLNIPLRSAIEHLMVFRCGHQQYALPLLSIRSAGETGGRAPSVVLRKLFSRNVDSNHEELASLQIDLETSPGRKASGQSNRVNLLVDEIIGPEEVVVRPLPTLLRSHPFCSGATLSSTGQTVLVLDARKLLANLWEQELVSLGEQGNEVVTADGKAQCTAAVDETGLVRATAAEALGNQPLILVVDDSISSRKAVVRSLKRFPLRIMEATDGRQAIQLLKSHRFAAIFSDLEMPHVDGLELLAEVRSHESSKNIPFIMITSRQENEFSSKALALGVNGYLSKPIHDSVLDSALSEISSNISFAQCRMKPEALST
jgi:chemosensory pili system protein ChpA (sensor histidine kinase/response regulator)